MRVISLIVSLLVAGCASVPGGAGPKLVHSFSGDKGVASMYDAPCTEPKVLQYIPPEHQPRFKAGEGTYEGPKYALCWACMPDGSGGVLIVWEDGGFGRLSADVLRGGRGA
jgi:hypothetical protein